MDTSEHIVTTALKSFYTQGFHASGVDHLAAAAGVTKKTLYRHYPSKDALIDAALALRHRQFMAKLRSFVTQAPVAHRPLAYIDFIASWTQEADFHGCAFINATAEYGPSAAPPHRQAAAHKQEVRDDLTDFCAQAGASQPASVALSLYLIGEGLIVACQVQGYDTRLAAAARDAARLLWSSAHDR